MQGAAALLLALVLLLTGSSSAQAAAVNVNTAAEVARISKHDVLLASNSHRRFPADCKLRTWDRASTRVLVLQTSQQRPLSPENVTHELTGDRRLMYDSSSAYYVLYAHEHGYTYKRVLSSPMSGSKPHHLKSLVLWAYLDAADIIVYLDFDVVIPMNADLLCLLEHWGFYAYRKNATSGDGPAVLQALDPEGNSFQQDAAGQHIIHGNTGVMVFRGSYSGASSANNRAKEILRAWWTATRIDATTRRDFAEGAKRWKDQGVWNMYVRREMTPGNDLILLPCDEANGFAASWARTGSWSLHQPAVWVNAAPFHGICKGRHITHMWYEKRATTAYFVHAIGLAGMRSSYDASDIRFKTALVTSQGYPFWPFRDLNRAFSDFRARSRRMNATT